MAALAVRATGSLPVAAASLKAVPFRWAVPPRGPRAQAAEAVTMKQQAPDSSSQQPLFSMHCVIMSGRRESRLLVCMFALVSTYKNVFACVCWFMLC